MRGWRGSKFRSSWDVSGLQGSSLVGAGVLGCWNWGSRWAAAPGKGAPCCSSLRPGRGVSCHLERGPLMGALGGACTWGPALYKVPLRGCLPLKVPGPLLHEAGTKNRCLFLGFPLLNNISEEAALKKPHWQHPCLRPHDGPGSEPGFGRGEPGRFPKGPGLLVRSVSWLHKAPIPPEKLNHGAVSFSTSLNVHISTGFPKCRVVIFVQRRENKAMLNSKMLQACHRVCYAAVALNILLFAFA